MASNASLRRVFALAVLAVVPACGVFVGIKELEVEPVVDSGAVEPVPDVDVEPVVDASEPEVYVPPVIDAGCKIISKGPFEPKTVSDKGEGTGWANTDNAKIADDKATESSTSFQHIETKTLTFTNYEVDVPQTARIFGVKAEIRAKRDGRAPDDYYRDKSVTLSLGNAPIGANLFRRDQNYPSSFESRVYGGETDPWGETLVLTHAIVTDSTFGIELRIKRSSGPFVPIGVFAGPNFVFSVDVVRITVFYCE